ncbi:abortive infection system antitoxin AbiGi family protein [Paenibacillus sp. PK1-4R]|uniref:abortive infection system antitoxin AbiGi family protein n=1 Tax=Paenibacillus sp. PK1-4R TaxID=3049075 RepID=UPI0025A112D6|nr:abortive infection system antitoxin AbiGi family protein [Paenibacillus sp. PK1-4R]WJM05898.1 abortive infection system antitoxin AbiGi family protein [Paenibacillus sp. PK1-4R]
MAIEQYSDILLDSAPQVTQANYTYRQSANVLFNFMPKLEYLKSKLSKKAMIPRFYEENIAYLDLSEMDKVAFPMVCFCDIHLNKLTYHMGGSNSSDGYGRYGIGMSKMWGIQEGVQPISYMNSSSALMSDFKTAFKHAMEQMRDGIGDEILHNQLATQLLFIKPLNGEMAKQRGASFEHISKNFHDEREWRFVPKFSDVDTDLSLIIPQSVLVNNLNNVVCNAYSDGIEQKEELWLKFEYEKIEYLIVDTVEDRDNLIHFIMDELHTDHATKYILISKIMVFTQLEKDW